MLKRNGEPCQYRVPGFSGRLTEAEYAAYSEAMVSVQDQVTQLTEGARTLAEIENRFASWRDLPVNGATEKVQVISVRGDQGAPWQILQSLSKTALNEVLFCSRPKGNAQEFGIIEKFSPDSAYARVHGTTEVLMTSNDPKILIQDHLDNERAILRLFRKDIEATVEEMVTEKYPGENMSRVIRAVGARCQCEKPLSEENNRSHAIGTKMKIQF
jgi:hypothetical protein